MRRGGAGALVLGYNWLEDVRLYSSWRCTRATTIERMELTQDANRRLPQRRPRTGFVRQARGRGPATVEVLPDPHRRRGGEGGSGGRRPVPTSCSRTMPQRHQPMPSASTWYEGAPGRGASWSCRGVRDLLLPGQPALVDAWGRCTWTLAAVARTSSRSRSSCVPLERDDEIVLGALDAMRGALARYMPERAASPRRTRSCTAPRDARQPSPETCGGCGCARRSTPWPSLAMPAC